MGLVKLFSFTKIIKIANILKISIDIGEVGIVIYWYSKDKQSLIEIYCSHFDKLRTFYPLRDVGSMLE